ncbi:MAG: DegT/DnrJ/EryC1/StrS family aminotransferase [Nitrospirota bacterium]
MGPQPIIPHSRPTLGDEAVQAVSSVVASGQVAQGPRVAEFERAVAKLVGVRGGVAVSSGTAALELALLVLGIGPGDEVLLPSYVCAAPWLATVRVGASPKLVDIEPTTYAIDPDGAKRALSARAKAIIVPHLFGLPADLTGLEALGVPLVEDCAQTLAATERGRQVGTVGTVTVCSFYATKLLCTGEGGMVLANDERLLERARALREYDERQTLDRRAFNHKMTDLQAALGISQLGRFGAFLRRRAAIADAYQEAFRPFDLRLPVVPEGRTHVYYRYVVRPKGGSRVTEELLARMERRGIHCRRPVFRPIHRYLGLEGYPASEEADRAALSVPIYPSLTEEEVARTIQTLREELA